MVPALRERFNAQFSDAKYASLVRDANTLHKWPTDFRVSESPIFFSPEFTREISAAATGIVSQLRTPEFTRHSAAAIPKGLAVPNESPHPTFIQVDFAICNDGAGRLTPRLIELQAFPSLYAFQAFLTRIMRKNYDLPADLTPFFGGLDERAYFDLLRRVIVGDSAPENVILLEIQPDQQKTRIDFDCTESALGVRPICLTAVRKRGPALYYDRDGRETRIERIYNRVIFDELQRKPLDFGFRFTEELDVKWVGHPNWYFRVSKHTLPFLRSTHSSSAFFADQFPAADSIEDFVLKPLYSFAGLGVDMEPTREKLAALARPHESILQRKVEYAPFVRTTDGGKSKAEVRMMFVWPDEGEPMLVNNLVRMSQGKMMGVDFNKNKTWVGSSLALHP